MRVKKQMTVIRTIPLLLLVGCLFVACSLAPKPSLPEPVAELPEGFTGSLVTGPHEPLEWWRAFSDPALNTIVDAVLASNLDLAEAVARVQQARAMARIARAEIFPVVRAGGDANDMSTPTNASVGAQLQELGLDAGQGESALFTLPDRLDLTTYSLGMDFSYELDLWGRARNDARAAGVEYLASESDFHAVRIGILADTITAYLEIAELRRRIALAREAVNVLLEREKLTSTRYDRGLSGSFDLYRVRKDLRKTQAWLPRLENRLAGAEGRLAVLLGGYRADLEAILPDSLSPSPVAGPVPAGIPADLLVQRPDVRAAGQRLEAARHDIGARRAELLPAFSFSGTIGVQSAQSDAPFDVDQWFRNLAANLTAPIFQGGRLKNNVALAQVRFNQVAAAYGRTVVTAVNEVEAALAGLENEGLRHALLASRLEDAEASEDLRSQRYASGVGGYTDYLDALRTRLDVESDLAGAGRDLALARLAVHRALGGAWTAPGPLAELRMRSARPATQREDR